MRVVVEATVETSFFKVWTHPFLSLPPISVKAIHPASWGHSVKVILSQVEGSRRPEPQMAHRDRAIPFSVSHTLVTQWLNALIMIHYLLCFTHSIFAGDIFFKTGCPSTRLTASQSTQFYVACVSRNSWIFTSFARHCNTTGLELIFRWHLNQWKSCVTPYGGVSYEH